MDLSWNFSKLDSRYKGNKLPTRVLFECFFIIELPLISNSITAFRRIWWEWNSCEAVVFYLEIASVNSLASESHNRSWNKVVDFKNWTVFDSDTSWDVFKDGYIFATLLLIYVFAIHKVSLSILKFLLSENTHDIVEDAWLQLLFLEEGSNDHSVLKRFDIENIVHYSRASFTLFWISLPLHGCSVFYKWSKFLKSQIIELCVLGHLFLFLSPKQVLLVVHCVRRVAVSHDLGLACCSIVRLIDVQESLKAIFELVLILDLLL